MEIQILDFIQTNFRSWLGDCFMVFFSTLGNAGILWIVLALVLLCIKRTRKAGIMMTIALIIDLILCNLLLKPWVARIRPFDINPLVELLVAKPKDYSFPSGHTAAAFASVSALFFAGEKKLWKIFGVIGIVIAYSRLYLYVHYPTDVLGGALLGILFGFLSKVIYDIAIHYQQGKK